MWQTIRNDVSLVEIVRRESEQIYWNYYCHCEFRVVHNLSIFHLIFRYLRGE